jgi:hypothetical protein
MFKSVTTALLLVFAWLQSSAQTSAPTSTAPQVLLWNDIDKTIYAGQDYKTYFIDFENISVVLSSIMVKDVLGGIVLQEDVSKLPVDAIFELNMDKLVGGTYDIELHSYTGVIRKTISLP